MDSQDSNSSAKRKNDDAFEFAEKLKLRIAEDPDYAIEGNLLFGKHLTYY